MGTRILVVDDDPMMLQMLPPHLTDLAVQPPVDGVETAQTPEAALAALGRMADGPLVVLSDFNLKASMNGLDLLKEVQRRRPDAVRVLFSGYALEQLGDVYAGGATHGFVEKPMRIREMLPPLTDIINRTLAEA